jgi:hypothetical protein
MREHHLTTGIRFNRHVLPSLTSAFEKCEKTLNTLWNELDRYGDEAISRESDDRRMREIEPRLDSAFTGTNLVLLSGLGSDGSAFEGELEIELPNSNS